MSICTLTDAAKAQIDLLCEENSCYAISLNIKGGGCAGFEYEWGMMQSPEELEEGDEVIKTDNNCSLVGSTFEIKNPNAQSSCGCGVSVNFDMDSIPQI